MEALQVETTEAASGQITDLDKPKRWNTPTGRHPGGRPTLYKPEFCEAAKQYFDVLPTRTTMKKMKEGDREWEEEVEVPNPLPNIAGLCRVLGISKDTCYRWMQEHQEFSDAVSRARVSTEDNLVQNGLTKLYDPKFSGLLANAYCGIVPTTKSEISGPGGGPIMAISAQLPPDAMAGAYQAWLRGEAVEVQAETAKGE